MTEFAHAAVEELELVAVLSALSDPARLDIVRQLACSTSETTCQAVALDMPKSTRSHHLRVLREAGVVGSEPRGRERLLTLRRDDLESRWPGLLGAVVAAEPAQAVTA